MMVIFIAVVFPSALMLAFISFEQKDQIDQDARQYLSNAFAAAYTIESSQLSDLRISASMLSANPEFIGSMDDSEYLADCLADLQKLVPYLDFLAVIQPDASELLASSRPSITGIPKSLREMLLSGAARHFAASSGLVFDLSEFSAPGSPEWERYQIKIMKTGEYFNKCLAGVAAAPILRDGRLVAYVALADIANNDNSMPARFTKSVEDAYFSLTVSGVRVCSNVRDAAGTSYIGSYGPVSSDQWERVKKIEFGRVNVGEEIHVFFTGYINDYSGKPIAALGVGIPEERFRVIMNVHKRITVLICAVTLLIVLTISHFVTKKITEPINLATEIAQKVSQGERNIAVPPYMLVGRQETARLLRALKEMAKTLGAMEQEIEHFVHNLIDSNNQLEEKVGQRTVVLQQMIRELERSNTVKSQFLSNMTHELRTPLSAVICSGEALLEGHFGSLTEKQAKHVNNMILSGRHLLQIINDILDISKIDAGMMKLNFSEFRFADALDQTLLTFYSFAGRKEITIRENCPENILLYADEKKIRQILYNLLSNALKFVPIGGKVWVDVRELDNMLRIAVKDNGIGIRKEDQERIFEAFEQADNSYSREYEGTGLGLPLCRYLVEMHGGEIYLNSLEGVGTEVIFTIPLNKSGKGEQSAHDAAAAG
jgi:signal transduction histidine kinase